MCDYSLEWCVKVLSLGDVTVCWIVGLLDEGCFGVPDCCGDV